MKSLIASLIVIGSLAASLVCAAPSAPQAKVIIGSTTCFVIHNCAAGETPQQRADHITDVFNKYLGGSTSTFAVKPTGKNAVIMMNHDRLLVVTPQDAKTAHAKSAVKLAAWWKTSLAKAFDETKATK